MPRNDAFLAISAITALIDRTAAPAREARARLVVAGKAFKVLTAPLCAAQAAYKLDLPQLRNSMEMK